MLLLLRSYQHLEINTNFKNTFPGGPGIKKLPANAGDMGWMPGSPGRSHMLQSN